MQTIVETQPSKVTAVLPTVFTAAIYCKALTPGNAAVKSEPVLIEGVNVPADVTEKLAYARSKMPAIEKAEEEMYDNGKYTGARFPARVQFDTIGQRTILIPKGENVAEVIARHM